MALAQPNQSRVNRLGSSTWKLSCISPVPAVVPASVSRARSASFSSPVSPATAIASGQTYSPGVCSLPTPDANLPRK